MPAPSPALARSVIGAPTGFEADQSPTAQQWLSEAQAAALSGPRAAGVGASLKAEGFVAGYRRLYHDRAEGMEADVRVYEFACRRGALDHLALQTVSSLGMIGPAAIAIPALPAAVGWAGAGPNSDDVYQQAAATTLGPYYAVVYTITASPLDGSYTATLLQAETALLRRWSTDPATTAAGPAGPPGRPALLTPQPGQSPVCPPSASPAPAARLEGWLPSDPSGFVRLSDSVPPAGPVTIAQLSATSAVPALAGAANRAEGFEGGYRRLWERADRRAQLQVEVDSFTCPDGAAAFVAQNSVARAGLRRFTVPASVPGGIGLITTGRNQQGHYRQAILDRMGSLVLIVSYFTSDPSTAALDGLVPGMVARIQVPGQP